MSSAVADVRRHDLCAIGDKSEPCVDKRLFSKDGVSPCEPEKTSTWGTPRFIRGQPDSIPQTWRGEVVR